MRTIIAFLLGSMLAYALSQPVPSRAQTRLQYRVVAPIVWGPE